MGFGGSIGHAISHAAKNVAKHSLAKKLTDKAAHDIGKGAKAADRHIRHYAAKATRVAVPVAAVAINYFTLGTTAGLTSRVIASNKSLGGGSALAAIGDMFTNFTTAFGSASNLAAGAATGETKLNVSNAAGIGSAGLSAAGYGGAATVLDFTKAATDKGPKTRVIVEKSVKPNPKPSAASQQFQDTKTLAIVGSALAVAILMW